MLCVNRFLAWLQDEFEDEPVKFCAELDRSIWNEVNGTAIIFDQSRLVLVLDDRSNLDEIYLPQEWIDISGWVADYYLAIQLDLEAGWLQVLGYTTKTRICQQAKYQAYERTYALNAEHLISNLNVMRVAQAVRPPQILKAQALPNVPSSQIEEMVQQLSQTIAYSPRLTVPFSNWEIIVSSQQYRQKLYDLRFV